MSTDVQIVILNLILVFEFWSIALWFSFDLTRTLFVALAVGFAFGALGILVILPGDIALMIGYEGASEHWFLSRQYRSLPARYIWAIGFGIVLAVLRFGRWIK